MSLLCTICARKGSKGVPNKNTRIIDGEPLIVHTIKQALRIERIKHVVVSTDSEEIAEVAEKAGAKVPFVRPDELASDSAPKLPVIQHAVKYCKDNLSIETPFIIDLDPTSPLRFDSDIEGCIDLIANEDCDSVITAYEADKNPYFNMVELNGKGFARLCKSPEVLSTGRQNAPKVYSMNASIYVWKTEKLLSQNHVISGNVKLYKMPHERSVDIDSELDFSIVELLFKKRREN